MRTAALAAGLIALTAASTLAKADDIVSFTVTGGGGTFVHGPNGFSNPTTGTISGGFTYDFTTNTVSDNTVSLTDGIYDESYLFDPYSLVTSPTTVNCVGYGLCQDGVLDPTGGYFDEAFEGIAIDPPGADLYGDYSGTITPTVTPEPSAVALFGTGLLGLVGTLRRRSSRV